MVFISHQDRATNHDLTIVNSICQNYQTFSPARRTRSIRGIAEIRCLSWPSAKIPRGESYTESCLGLQKLLAGFGIRQLLVFIWGSVWLTSDLTGASWVIKRDLSPSGGGLLDGRWRNLVGKELVIFDSFPVGKQEVELRLYIQLYSILTSSGGRYHAVLELDAIGLTHSHL